MIPGLRLISTPLDRDDKLEVVSVADVKMQARISHSDEDELIAEYIEAAYDHMSGPDGWLNGCCFLEETWEVTYASPLARAFDLPLRPVRSITSFERLVSGTTYEAVDPAIYSGTSYGRDVYRLQLTPFTYWPGAYDPPRAGAFRIRFKAGFGTEREQIPAPLRQGIRLLAAHWFMNREATATEGRSVGGEINFGLNRVCGRYRFFHDPS